MNTIIHCTIANQKVVISNHSIKTTSSSLQIELVKRLIECKAKVDARESALPLFYNKYLRHYPLSDLELIENKDQTSLIQHENWNNKSNVAA